MAKDEIKEKIDDIFWEVKKHPMDSDYLVKKEEMELLLDYITNLEKENENRISESLSYDLSVVRIKELEQENKVLLEKYSTIQILYNSSKLKNEKAVEYIKSHKQRHDIDGSIAVLDEFDILASPKTLLSILQGGDK